MGSNIVQVVNYYVLVLLFCLIKFSYSGYSYNAIENELWQYCYTSYSVNLGSISNKCVLLDCNRILANYGINEYITCQNIKLALSAFDDGQRNNFEDDIQDDLQTYDFDENKIISDNITHLLVEKSLLDSGTNQDDADTISDWEPISDNIAKNQTKYYQFNVNTKSTGLSSYYHVLIFLSGNICSLPSGFKNEDIDDSSTALEVYFSFNVNLFANISSLSKSEYSKKSFEYGYMQDLATHEMPNNLTETYITLYILVKAPDLDYIDEDEVWSYQIGASQSNLIYQWDDRNWISLVDTDDTSTLFSTGNLSEVTNHTDSSDFLEITTSLESASDYDIYVYKYSDNSSFGEYQFNGLNRSWCAVKNNPSLYKTSDMQTSFTRRGGLFKKQFYLDGLNASTKYIVYSLQNFNGTLGGVVFNHFVFETKSSNSCQLIYDLEFCSDIAYTVPASTIYPNVPLARNSSTIDSDNMTLPEFYDNYAKSIFENFEKNLQQEPCQVKKEERFSPILTCEDCAQSYKDWLCAVTIPRCTTETRAEYKKREVGKSRLEHINELVKPQEYFEILPCLNMCYALPRDCPASFGFQCPGKNSTVKLSYFWDEDKDYATCNFVGKLLTSAAKRLLINHLHIFVSLFIVAIYQI
ncbi:Mid1p ASCRUDRAFT_73151 [Ascoidea rubescens DSM 1968]|uniref:FZ domain-containing protein n=1 Tax=Ascoidea rubescens DSM 1968 TaxID=1344418 RepID=A0A1D2VNQ6_9ASCO|nr:hypothetical protein ASCRUDRAFT_73151 [Ascoidea rubescens DSM 1968]ODV63252.1 hypothetical protein ASCRUDRAFT_73151 [Ascoidea rubescens DSM 1968]